MVMAQFVNNETPDASSSAKEVSMKLTCDMTIEVCKYSHSERSGFRNTLFVMCKRHRDLHALKKDLRKDDGLTTDAKRYQIGDFNVEIGISRCGKTYMANT